MGQAWRIVKEKYAASAFSGEGASRAGGRWNSKGIEVVYASGTWSLAALETLVHLNPRMAFKYAVFRIEFDDALVEKYPLKKLPSDWQEEPPSSSTKDLGDLWFRKYRSAVLELPSTIISSESNFLLNPHHPDYAKIRISKPVEFAFDRRLLT